MKRILYPAILSIFLITISCQKDIEVDNFQAIRLVNYSDVEIDSIWLLSYSYGQNLLFENILPDSTTECGYCNNMYGNLRFRFYIDSIEFTEYWNMPSDFIDPSFPEYYPEGEYEFAIISIDSSGKNYPSTIIGLTYFSKLYDFCDYHE